MLGKLAVRNVKRSAKDYLVYVITMMLITALMFAFNSVLFSRDVRERFDMVGIMAAMIGLATFFIVIIVAWLINYMVRFMLEKRSREFGTYLLLGMKKKEISRLYMRENMIMGACAFLAGMVLGVFLQQMIMAVLYTMLQDHYHLKLEFNRWCILMTVCCYGGCYLLALFRCSRRFKKMNIRDLMDAGNKNEEIKESHERVKQWLLPLAVLFLIFFGIWLFFGGYVYSPDVEEDFSEEIHVLEEYAEVKEAYSYYIYENGTDQVNVWLYTHLKCFGTMFKEDGKEDGKADLKAIRETDDGSYCRYDTYMKLSDYNHLRRMLGYAEIPLKKGEYLIHIKRRVLSETGDFSDKLTVEGEKGQLSFAGYYTESFSQDGHNGGDYVIVLPDENAGNLRPCYKELAADLKGEAPSGLSGLLDDLETDGKNYGHLDIGDEDDEEAAEEDLEKPATNSCYGTDQIISYAAVNLVRDNVIPEVKYMLSSIVFPCFYTGLVFVCVALTVLSVQQLSDSTKYKFRYDVLRKIGLRKKNVGTVIGKQLFWYYLCPAVFAAGIAGIIAVFISKKFIFYTGVQAPVFQYFGISFLLFFGIYGTYFATTYLSFRRNVENQG